MPNELKSSIYTSSTLQPDPTSPSSSKPFHQLSSVLPRHLIVRHHYPSSVSSASSSNTPCICVICHSFFFSRCLSLYNQISLTPFSFLVSDINCPSHHIRSFFFYHRESYDLIRYDSGVDLLFFCYHLHCPSSHHCLMSYILLLSASIKAWTTTFLFYGHRGASFDFYRSILVFYTPFPPLPLCLCSITFLLSLINPTTNSRKCSLGRACITILNP